MKNNICKWAFISIAFFSACTGQTKNSISKCKQIAPAKYATLLIDRNEEGKFVPGDFDPYLGPAAMDLDSSGNIYLLNADNTIQKFDKLGKKIWSMLHSSQQLDIKVFKNELFSFDGRCIILHDIDNGKVNDSIIIQIDKKDYTPIGNVSKFYGKKLFISKWFITREKELVYVFDLEKRQVSSRVPEGINLFPITKCQACSLAFVEKLFKSKDEFFINESEEYIAYFNSNSNNVFIFNKQNGKIQKFCNLPQEISTLTIRFATFSSKNELVLCTIKMVDFEPKSLVFYKLKITI